jgi:hypothetical protein
MLKLKYLTAATLLAIAGSAQAELAQLTSGDGELFLNIWDQQGSKSYIFDLTPIATPLGGQIGDLKISTFLPGDLDNAQGLPSGVTAGELVTGATGVIGGASNVEQQGVSLSWTLDTSTQEWNAFVNSGPNFSSLLWNVVAGDSTGSSTTKHADRYLTTVAPGTTALNPSSSQFSALSNVDALAQQLNLDNPGIVDPANFDTDDLPADGDYFGDAFGATWLGALPVSSMGLLGTSLDFYYMTGRSVAAITEQFENGAKWSFDIANGVGSLTYTTNPAGPVVPVPAAVWLLGSGLIGLMGVARRRNAA